MSGGAPASVAGCCLSTGLAGASPVPRGRVGSRACELCDGARSLLIIVDVGVQREFNTTQDAWAMRRLTPGCGAGRPHACAVAGLLQLLLHVGPEAGGAAGVALAAKRAKPAPMSPASAAVLAADGGAGGGRGCARPRWRPRRSHEVPRCRRVRAILCQYHSAVLGWTALAEVPRCMRVPFKATAMPRGFGCSWLAAGAALAVLSVQMMTRVCWGWRQDVIWQPCRGGLLWGSTPVHDFFLKGHCASHAVPTAALCVPLHIVAVWLCVKAACTWPPALKIFNSTGLLPA